MSATIGQIKLTLKVEAADGQFAAHCPQLGTVSCGDTADEALSNIREAVRVHLDALSRNGTLRRVLEERDIEIVPVPPPDEPTMLPVPTQDWSIIADRITSSVRVPVHA